MYRFHRRRYYLCFVFFVNRKNQTNQISIVEKNNVECKFSQHEQQLVLQFYSKVVK